MLFLWHKALPANIDLNFFFSGILAPEIRIDNSLIPLLLRIPLICRPLLLPGRLVNPSLFTLLQGQRFIQCPVIQVYAAGMTLVSGKIPVSVNRCSIRIVPVEHAIVHAGNPYISFIRLPVLYFFRTADDRPQRFCGTIYNSVLFCSPMDRINIFSVYPRQDNDFVPGLGRLSRFIDSFKRSFLCTVAITYGFCIYINLHSFSPIYFIITIPSFPCQPAIWRSLSFRRNQFI